MPPAKPGDFITAKCSRCDDVTGHVVMLVLDGQIAKVECKACGSVHKYREYRPQATGKQAPSLRRVRAGQSRDAAVDVGAPRARAASTSGQKSAPAVPRGAAKLHSAWQESMVRLSAQTPRPYSMQEAFEVDSLLEHPSFGRGVVLKAIKPDKIDVLFEDGLKTLRCKL